MRRKSVIVLVMMVAVFLVGCGQKKEIRLCQI